MFIGSSGELRPHDPCDSEQLALDVDVLADAWCLDKEASRDGVVHNVIENTVIDRSEWANID